jgi:PAS domain S-box-containing protein
LDQIETRFGLALNVLLDDLALRAVEATKSAMELRASETRFRRLAESGIIGIIVADLLGNILEANDAALSMFGYTREELLAAKMQGSAMTPSEWRAGDEIAIGHLKSKGVAPAWEKEFLHKDGHRVPILIGAAMLDETKCISFIADLTARKLAEQVLHQTESQLRQAQKMEAIGRLAGGVAHDFNNVLSVILTYSEFIFGALGPSDPMRDDVDEIRKAGQRAADLTRQLLMFSRQQVVEPKVLDLNDVLHTMDKMLQRILGEDVDLVSLPEQALGRVNADPSSVEQVIMNLVVNARDAMPTGGKLTIETANVTLDDAYAIRHVGITPGPYVMLAVTDTGIGMDKATLARVFEPFFTTKDRGKGTGLGMSTVFGIVQQSGGSVWIYSEVGRGTTVKVYLPRTDRSIEAMTVPAEPIDCRGTETILLVEDEDQVRAAALGILSRQGYDVIEARSGGEALLICEKHLRPIHLLLTDVVMPQMSGPELSKRLAALEPNMKLLCMSGYTDDSIFRHGVLEAEIAFLQKPFTPQTLTRRVREVIDTPNRNHQQNREISDKRVTQVQ